MKVDGHKRLARVATGMVAHAATHAGFFIVNVGLLLLNPG